MFKNIFIHFLRFPPEKYPVLAFPGAPGSFPIDQESVPRHRYLMWNASFDAQIEEMIATLLPRPYVAIHLRNDRDFVSACIQNCNLHSFIVIRNGNYSIVAG